MVRTRKKGYTRKGDYVEVRIGKGATYQEVTQACYCAVMDAGMGSSSEDDDADAESLALFRANGAIILDRPIESTSSNMVPWSLGAYMGTFQCYQKTGVTIKCGIGFTAKVTFCDYINCNDNIVYRFQVQGRSHHHMLTQV